MQRYMIIERFSPDQLDAIYKRLQDKGRMLPEGLHFVDSWLTRNNSTVYQLMETDDPALLALWQTYWDDLVAFEVHPLRDKPD